MMTATRSTITTCPDWVEDVPADLEVQFRSGLRAAYATIRVSATQAYLTDRELRVWHKSMFDGLTPIDYYAGEFRQDDPTRACLGIDNQVGMIAGCPFRLVVGRMEVLLRRIRLSLSTTEVRWSNLTPSERSQQVAIVLAGLIGGFIRIHPFINGNGRVSRLMWAWGLLRFNVPAQCRIHPRPDSPYSVLMAASMSGDDGPLAVAILQHLAAHNPAV